MHLMMKSPDHIFEKSNDSQIKGVINLKGEYIFFKKWNFICP